MRVLGLDPSLTNFGWALHDPLATGKARCLARGRFQTGSSTLYIDRYVAMRESLRSLVRELDPDKVGIEFPVFGDLWSEGMYGLFLFCSEALHLERRDVVFWSPMQVKAHAREFLRRPDGWKMGKADMVEAAVEDTGGRGAWNHNEADAYLVAKLAARFWMLRGALIGEADLSPVERGYFVEVKRYVRGKKAGKIKQKGVLYREDERFFMWSEDGDNGAEGQGSGDDDGGTGIGEVEGSR